MEDQLKNRMKAFSLAVIKLVNTLPNTTIAVVLGKQLLRSSTSIGANYRSACRGKSKADFIAKLAIVEEESDEAIYWLELLTESGLIAKQDTDFLREEANEFVAIMVSSIKTLKQQTAQTHSKIQNQDIKNQYVPIV